MDKDFNTGIVSDTSQLLTDLENALDQSAAMRDIVEKSERLHGIESIAGPSIKTRILREEIDLLERALRLERY